MPVSYMELPTCMVFSVLCRLSSFGLLFYWQFPIHKPPTCATCGMGCQLLGAEKWVMAGNRVYMPQLQRLETGHIASPGDPKLVQYLVKYCLPSQASWIDNVNIMLYSTCYSRLILMLCWLSIIDELITFLK